MSGTTLARYVSDHRLHDRPILPGVMSLEMLLAGATSALGTPVARLRHLAFHRPAWAGSDGSLRTQLRCRPQPQGLLCQLYTAANGDSADVHWLEHASATAAAEPVPAPEPLDLGTIRGRCSHGVVIDDLYQRLAGYGLHYGPSLRALRRLSRNGSEVFVELRVPAAGADEAAACRLHPALLDASLQALACLALDSTDDGASLFLPFAAEEVRVHAPLQGRAFGHGRLERSQDIDRYSAEVTLTDERGRVLVELRGLRARRVPVKQPTSSRPVVTPATPPQPRPVARILRPSWQASPPGPEATVPTGPRLVFADTAGVGEKLAQQLATLGPVAVVSRGPCFRVLGEQRFEVNPQSPEDHARLWQSLAPTEIIHCWACDAGTPSHEDLSAPVGDAFFSLAHLVRTLRDSGVSPELALRVVTADCQAAAPSDGCPRPLGALAWGLARVLALEYRPWRVQCLDVSLAEATAEGAAAVLLPDLAAAPRDAEVAFRAGRRLTPTAEALPATELDRIPSPVKPGGVYLITGGLGGLGLALAEWLARQVKGVRLVLVGRTAGRRLEAVARLEALGAKVETVAADAGDAAAVRDLTEEVRRHGRLDAVFHSAGVVRDALLQRKALDGVTEVFRPKVAAALALDAACGEVPLVLFSSVVGWLGNVGQADYAAANRFLDSFAVYRSAHGRPTLSVAWGPWAEVGMAAALEPALRARGIDLLTPAAALDALDRALSSTASQVSIAAMPAGPVPTAPPSATPNRPGGRFGVADVQAYLARRLAKFLEVDAAHVTPNARFQDFGIDSISAVQMLHQLETATGLSLPPTLLFDHSDLPSLAGHLHRHVAPERLEALLGDQPLPAVEAPSIPPPPPAPAALPGAEGNEVHSAAAAPVVFEGADDYSASVRPLLAQRLAALRLDRQYLWGGGDYLEYQDGEQRTRVLDLLGGFGSTLFGHNHPELVGALRDALVAGVPTHAQVSLRGASGRLARELAARVRAFTGRDYVAVFGNSGAEAIEAALKHAWMELRRRTEAWRRRQRQADALLLHAWARGPRPSLPAGLVRDLTGVAEVAVVAPDDLAGLLHALGRHNATALDAKPRFFAVRRSFHGKTAGALQLTYNPDYQAGGGDGAEVEFLDPRDAASVRTAVEGSVRSLLTLVEDGRGGLALRRENWCSVAAAFVEPIQGEGGVHPLDPRLLAELRDLADRHNFPIVVDEIQCGLGRCGAFTAAEGTGLRGDYYAFAKALGGGVAKVAALLIDRERYVPEFGIAHSSTFAEDDPGALVALRALSLLDRDGLPARCAAWGADMLAGLRKLRREFADVIADVRGRGCLLGVELVEQSRSPSALLRQAGPYLGLLASSYLLSVHRIRLLPTTSAPLTLRLEPSAYVSREDGERCLAALRQFCLIVSRANAGRLVRHLVDDSEADPFAPVADWSNRPVPEDVRPEPGEPMVAFFSYFIEPEDVVWWEPSLEEVPRERHGELIRRFSRVAPAGVARRTRVRSATGRSVCAEVVGFLATSEHLEEALLADDLDWLRAQVDDEVDRAVREGVRAIGFGGYLSIVTHNAVQAARPDVSLTTGNALTVSAGLELWRRGCLARGLDLSACRVAVVGAYGNIGSTYARVVAEEARRVLLVGRPRSGPRLRELAAQLLADAWDRLAAARGRPAAGVADGLLRNTAVRARLGGGPLAAGEAAALFAEVERELGDDAPLCVSDDLNDLRRCPAILTASNAAEPIIFPEHLGAGPVVVCDVAVPADVAAEVARERPDVLVISGGEVRLPLGQRPGLCGRHLPPESVFACLGETLLLGLSGWQGHFSFGPINHDDVHTIARLAREHGFAPAGREGGG